MSLGLSRLKTVTECREQTETGCLEQFHDASNPRRVRLVCNNQNEMIRVKRAFLATFNAPLQTAHAWCNNPNYDSSHCKQYESQLTDDFIKTCSTRSVCSLNQYYTELPNCPSTILDPEMVRRTYIHVEFDCLPSELHCFVSILLYCFATKIKIPNKRKKNCKLESISFIEIL